MSDFPTRRLKFRRGLPGKAKVVPEFGLAWGCAKSTKSAGKMGFLEKGMNGPEKNEGWGVREV